MAKKYEAKTISKFGGLRVSHSPNAGFYDNADLEDNESGRLVNLNFTDTGGLVKRHSIQNINSAVAPTTTKPAGQALTAPNNIYLLAIQRIQSAFNDRLYYTNLTKTDLWYSELTSLSNAVTFRVMTPTNQSLSGVEWMIPAATPSQLYAMLVCRSTGPGCIIIDQGYPQAFITGMPNGTHMTIFKDRVFLINSLATNGDENKIYYSDEANYTSWGANSFNRVGVSNGDYMVATLVFNDTLMIFKSRSIWVLVADGAPPTWSYRNLHPTIGCSGRGTPTVINGMIYFQANDGVYRTDGTSFEKISEPVDSIFTFDTANPTNILRRTATYYDDKYALISTGNSSQMYIYDTRHDAWCQWDTYTSEGNIVPYTDVAGSTSKALYMGTAGAARIRVMYDNEAAAGVNDWTDAGSPYACTWRSKRQTWDDPTKLKRNYMFAMDVSHIDGITSGNITITHKTDSNDLTFPFDLTSINAINGVSPVYAAQAATSRRELKFPGAGYGRAIETQVDFSTSGSFELYSVSWLNQVKDTINRSN